VDTLTRPMEIGSPQPPARRRWVRRVLVSVGVGLLAFSGVYLARYQPLSADGTGATWVDPRHATRLGDFSPPVGESFSAYRVRYEDGSSFSYAMTLSNEGPLPVTITSIGEDGCRDCPSPLVFERAVVAPDGGTFQHDRKRATPFHGFVLQPGSSRYVVIETRFDNCESYAPPGGVTYGSIPVGYRTWGVEHQVLLPMPYSLDVWIGGEGCPGGPETG
jgi:hypothetical protein